MKFISWNVNGLRACNKKGFSDFFRKIEADFFCIQETKLQAEQINLSFNNYQSFWNYAEKKGYSGTAIFTKHEPLEVKYGIGIDKYDTEGRTITLEMPKFYLVTAYVPNAQVELRRLNYRIEWDRSFREYLINLDKKKPVVICGDMNVAHKEIDLKNPRNNHYNPGFTDEEREDFSKLLDSGFIDTYRNMHPQTVKYSWWSYRSQSREKNIGWRIDYFITSMRLANAITRAEIHDNILGSDHCPVEMILNEKTL